MKKVAKSKQMQALAFALSGQVFLICMPPAQATNESQMNVLRQIEICIADDQPVSKNLFAGLEQILEAEPKNYQARLLLGECYEQLTLKDQAMQQYRMAAENTPDDPQAMLKLIKMQVREGQIQSASALLDQAIKKFPDDAEIKFWQGNFEFEKNPLKAEVSYLKAIKENDQIVGLPTALAELRLKKRQYLDAYLLASTDIVRDPKFWTAYKVKGFAAFAMGNFAQAAGLLSVAFDHLRGKSQAAKGLAMACLRSGQYDVGLEPALVHLAFTSNLTERSQEQKKLVMDLWRQIPVEQARQILSRTEGLYGLPHNSAYHFAMGDVFDKLGLVPDAVQEYQRGLTVTPDFARGLFRLGFDLETYYQQYDDALADYSSAAKLAPSDQEIASNLVRLQNRLKEKDGDLAWRIRDYLHKPDKPI